MALYHEGYASVSKKASTDYLDRVFVDMMWYKAFSVYFILKEGTHSMILNNKDDVVDGIMLNRDQYTVPRRGLGLVPRAYAVLPRVYEGVWYAS